MPEEGAIPSDTGSMPETIHHDAATRRLHMGAGWVENIAPEVWAYEISGKRVLAQWFSYRGRDRSRPMIGDRRAPSPLGDIQPAGWLAEYTAELLNVVNVLVRLEPAQAALLARACAGATIGAGDLPAAVDGAGGVAAKRPGRRGTSGRAS